MAEKADEKGKRILDWYIENRRDLPWRKSRNPYNIWISEIMLQQTRVDTVIEYYNRFMQHFTDLRSLAEAPEEEVLTLWKGLGYYSRARNLHKAAKQIVEQYGGEFPGKLEEVRELPGVGAYTAGAIMSIAYNQPCPAVDGNVLRVVSRLEGLEEDIGKETVKKTVTDIVARMMSQEAAGDFTQAMMELGALVCVPGVPRCDQCPVRSLCNAFLTGRQEELPVKKKKDTAVPELKYWMAIVEWNGCILLEYREKESLLKRMWGVPMVEKGDADASRLFGKKYGIKLQFMERLGSTVHIFSHRKWDMEVGRYTLLQDIPEGEGLHWIPLEELKNTAIPTAFQKVLKLASLQ